MNVSSGRGLKRVRLSYDTNQTMARMIELPLQKKVSNITSLLLNPSITDGICDHAYRRVQIFYAQASVYHNKECDIWRGKTIRQHGRSNYSWSSAAHSAILPNLYDTKNLITKDSHLYEVMNSTVELPHVVNEYDCVIEDVMRKKSVVLLNYVSKEGLTPHKATEIFVLQMQNFFMKSERETSKKIALIEKIVLLEQEIWEKEKSVDFTNIGDYLDTLQVLGRHSRVYKKMNGHSIHRRLRGRLPWQSGFFKLKKPYSWRLRIKVLNKILESKEWFPQPGDALISKQKHALTILFTQRRGSVLPPLHLLQKLCENSLEK